MKAKFMVAMALSFAWAVSAQQYYSSDFKFVKSSVVSLPVEDVKRFKIDAGAGSLSIIGTDTDEIQVKADIYQSEGSSDYCLGLEENSGFAELKANVCHTGANYTLVHLSITLPSELLTDIKDGSGSIKAHDVSIGSIDDESGSIALHGNLTALQIEDGSGKIEVLGNKGKVLIEDGSGKIYVENVEGDVKVKDGSGNVVIENVSGKVAVQDGSGNITVRGADAFRLLGDGSGNVKLYDVKSE
ncbi:hypothetical protein J8M20_07675 [Pseudoalteromonas luteoviolacea]|uniref:hypothetical protein n=1 Tax=Pseudoalteromonas luteoviolacea TaxID=43657 RepID=UPI001B388DD5|nr:hypothetical protein [Pseudoalteromonas luteoviolacea]MBQ4811210.1 hypothetical protein [Pseudoalteromonas luteoviolacea]